MRRAILLVILTATLLGGCIRIDFDLCEEEPPHPDCLADGDVEMPEDAGPGDGG